MWQWLGKIAFFLFAVLLNTSVFSCICISIKRGKKLEILQTMDNFAYMKYIRILLIFSTIFLFFECIGFFIHYNSFHRQTAYKQYDELFDRINIKISNNPSMCLSDIIIYLSFLLFLLCSVASYYIALHRFLITNHQSNESLHDWPYRLHSICLVCYLIISLTVITFCIIHLLLIQDSIIYFILFICFDCMMILSSIPVFKSLKKVCVLLKI